MFVCPNCRSGLHPWRHGKQTSFFCPRCRGMALTRSSLERAVRAEVFAELVALVAARVRELKERQFGKSCAASSARSVRILARGKSSAPVALDFCSRCGMVWFDAGEIESLEAIPEKDEVDPVEAEREKQRDLAAMMIDTGDPAFALRAAGLPAPPRRFVDPAICLSDLSYEELVARRLRLGAASVPALSNPDRKRTGRVPWLSLFLALAWVGAYLTYRDQPGFGQSVWPLIFNLVPFLVAGADVEELIDATSFAVLMGGAVLAVAGAAKLLGFGHFVVLGAVTCGTGTTAAALVFYTLSFPKASVGWREHLGFGEFLNVSVPAWLVSVLWLAGGALLGLSGLAGEPAAALVALAGGTLVGFLYWLVWR